VNDKLRGSGHLQATILEFPWRKWRKSQKRHQVGQLAVGLRF